MDLYANSGHRVCADDLADPLEQQKALRRGIRNAAILTVPAWLLFLWLLAK